MQDMSSSPSLLYRLAMIVPYAVTAGLVGLLLYCNHWGETFNVSFEDGFVEWGTCVSFLLCGVLAFIAVGTKWVELTRAQVVFLIVFGLVAWIAVGEELSWGQRFFGFQPPAAMESHGGNWIRTGHNDVTWHNLTFDFGFMKFSLGGALFGVPIFLALFLHGVWLPVWFRRGGRKTVALVKKLGLFLPPLHLGILLLAGTILFHYRKLWGELTDSREYKEMLIPAVYVFVLLHCFFRTRRWLDVAVTAAGLGAFLLGVGWSLYKGIAG